MLRVIVLPVRYLLKKTLFIFHGKENANHRRKYVRIFSVTWQPAIGTSPCRIVQGLFKEYKGNSRSVVFLDKV